MIGKVALAPPRVVGPVSGPHTLVAYGPIRERQERMIQDFLSLDDPMDRYRYLVELARRAPPFGEDHKTDGNLIHGCQAQVWFRAYMANGHLHFEADSPSLIVKGLAALLIQVLSDSPPEAIVGWKPSFLDAIGLQQHLSPTRANGLSAMVKRMQAVARARARGAADDPDRQGQA